MKRALMILTGLLLLLPLVAGGQTGTTTRTVSWAPPVVDATHSAADHYVFQWRIVGVPAWTTLGAGPITSAQTSVEIPVATAVECRVAAVDAAGNQGPWSQVSDPYTFKTPGACGKPSWL